MEPRLTIVLDVRHVRDFGIGSYIRNLLIALSQIDERNRYVLVGRDSDLSELPQLGPNFEFASFPRSDSGTYNQFRFPLFVRRFRPDVIHIPLNSVPIFLPRPYVVTVHDMASLRFQLWGAADISAFRRNYRLFRFRRGLERASCILAVSHSTRQDLENGLGIPPERIRQIYGAPDPRFFPPPHQTAREASAARARVMERYQLRDPFLLYVGSVRPQKNIPKLVEAFAVVRNELANHPIYRNLKLVLIGEDFSPSPDVRLAVIRSGVEPAVRFLGFVPFETLRMFYQSAAAFVFPSLYEGFGLPPLEAMASGTPVVTSNTSSLPEVVGDAAETVNPENVFDIARGIREVLLNRELRAVLISRGHRRAHEFQWGRTARAVLETYREVASGWR